MKYKKTERISLEIRTRQGCLLSISSLNIAPEVPARLIREEKAIK